MPRGFEVTGSVRDANGEPVEGAVVVWGDDPYFDQGSQEVRTDRQGVYALPPRPAGPLNVTVIADGWAPELKNIDVSASNARLDFQLKRGRTVRFVFVDQDGKPIPGVGVGISGWRGIKSLYNHIHPNVVDTRIPTTANEQGMYEWTWAPDDTVTYYFGKEGYATAEDREFFADDQEHVITLKKE